MQPDPSEPQVVAVAKGTQRESALIEGSNEFIVAQVRAPNNDSPHRVRFVGSALILCIRSRHANLLNPFRRTGITLDMAASIATGSHRRKSRMKRIILAVSSILLIGIAVVAHHLHGQAACPLAHESSSFDITVNAPYEVAAPLFGAQGERAWAGKEWDPQFLYPQPASDVSGAVFTVSHGPHHMLWITPVFDIPNRHIQHVIIIPDHMVATIDIRLQPSGDGKTRVHVIYEHTALTPSANEQVHNLAMKAAAQAQEWETAINQSLSAQSEAKSKANQ